MLPQRSASSFPPERPTRTELALLLAARPEPLRERMESADGNDTHEPGRDRDVRSASAAKCQRPHTFVSMIHDGTRYVGKLAKTRDADLPIGFLAQTVYLQICALYSHSLLHALLLRLTLAHAPRRPAPKRPRGSGPTKLG